MFDDYDPIKLSSDAVAFAQSEFGKHYLDHLKTMRDEQYKTVKSEDFTDSARAHAGTRADVYDKLIEYFEIAKTIQSDPTLMQRVRANFERRMRRKKDV